MSDLNAVDGDAQPGAAVTEEQHRLDYLEVTACRNGATFLGPIVGIPGLPGGVRAVRAVW